MLADMHEFCRQIYKQILSCYSIFAYKMDMHTIILVHRYYFYRQICDRQHIYCPVLFYNILYYKICPIPILSRQIIKISSCGSVFFLTEPANHRLSIQTNKIMTFFTHLDYIMVTSPATHPTLS